ncbi:hypothetical protein D3C80_1327810 [compost metagenome]
MTWRTPAEMSNFIAVEPVSPVRAAASPRLRKAMSVSGQRLSNQGWRGDGLNAVIIPVAFACDSARRVVVSPRLPCTTRRSPGLAVPRVPATSSGVRDCAQAVVVTMLFSPSGVLKMMERSLVCPSMPMRSAVRGSVARRARMVADLSSVPTAAVNVVSSPHRAMTMA